MLRSLTRWPRAHRPLVFASATHLWSDLFFALHAPLLPLIRNDPELELSFTEVGLLRSVYVGAGAVLQIPAGFLAERVGEFWMLIGGNIWVALGFVGMAAAHGYFVLLAVTLVGGLGGGTQHPLHFSMVSRAYDDRGRATAVGIVNFAGDLGKLLAPAVVLLIAVHYGWRSAVLAVGLGGVAFMVLSVFTRQSLGFGQPAPASRVEKGAVGEAVRTAGFINLSGVGALDSATRGAALVFLPFVMEAKGMSVAQFSLMLMFLLAGGAFGKFVCGWLGDRFGTVKVIWGTKGLTVLLLIGALYAPPLAMAPLLVVLGIGLNGTSSVLYAAVATLVAPRRRARMYGYYTTTNEGAAFFALLLYGRIADLFGLRAAVLTMSAVAALILPASIPLKKFLAPAGAGPPQPPANVTG